MVIQETVDDVTQILQATKKSFTKTLQGQEWILPMSHNNLAPADIGNVCLCIVTMGEHYCKSIIAIHVYWR